MNWSAYILESILGAVFSAACRFNFLSLSLTIPIFVLYSSRPGAEQTRVFVIDIVLPEALVPLKEALRIAIST
jgi:hypothetical protein